MKPYLKPLRVGKMTSIFLLFFKNLLPVFIAGLPFFRHNQQWENTFATSKLHGKIKEWFM